MVTDAPDPCVVVYSEGTRERVGVAVGVLDEAVPMLMSESEEDGRRSDEEDEEDPDGIMGDCGCSCECGCCWWCGCCG